MPLDLHHDIRKLRGAEYNPRAIDEATLAALAESIQRLGLVKPLICRGNLLVAGHQRTKALRRLGETHAAVYVLPRETTVYDEVRFNQLHNGTDMDGGDENVRIAGGLPRLGFQIVEAGRLSGNARAKMAHVRAEIASLIIAYGPWGGMVATRSGRVIHCAQYALAAMVTRTPLTVYAIPDEREGEYRAFLDRRYGKFSYAGIQRETYIQTFAQMFRLREGPRGREQRSSLYELAVLPYLAGHRDALALDFGSGQGDYAGRLRREGFRPHDVELFRRAAGVQAIDLGAVNRMIDGLVRQLLSGVRYDVVICDSVLNSIDCQEAEDSVMTLLNAFARPGGQVFFSGRPREAVERRNERTQQGTQHRAVEFLDDEGQTALYRKGRWFFQKFHSREQVERICERFGLAVVAHERMNGSETWRVHATKARELDRDAILKAATYEFDLPVSETRRLGRHGDVVRALERALPSPDPRRTSPPRNAEFRGGDKRERFG